MYSSISVFFCSILLGFLLPKQWLAVPVVNVLVFLFAVVDGIMGGNAHTFLQLEIFIDVILATAGILGYWIGNRVSAFL